jgi:hypothetical protein
MLSLSLYVALRPTPVVWRLLAYLLLDLFCRWDVCVLECGSML